MSTLAELMGRAPLSIQRLNVVNKSDGSAANTYTIAAVNPSTSALFVLGTGGRGGVSTPGAASNPSAYLNSATQVIATSNISGSTARNTQICVVDFGRLVKNVQRGILNGPTVTVSIAAVNPAKCLVLVNYNNAGVQTAAPILNATSFALESTYTQSFTSAYWQVVEFY